MRTYTLLILLLLSFEKLLSQQWIVQKYSYDSIMNVNYGTAIDFNGGTDSLHMDIYLPQCDDPTHTSRRPLMLWIHGGAFLAGSKDEANIQAFCKRFAQRGYVTAAINYRLGFVSDNNLWQCNYPNYSCVFASDSAEWVRAYYRAIQDAKGGLRYLINRHQTFRIDTNNVFVCGESAGAFTALGVALMDTAVERPIQTYALANVPNPNSATLSCDYNVGKNFSGPSVSRPDLGSIDGNIEPSSIHYRIKGIGNMYGGMLANLLQHHSANQPKPAIYSFHQPCDMVVPIDSGFVYWGLSWCFTNGYNCYGITNNQSKIYGSRGFSYLNTQQNYGYTIQNEFTTINFPYSFLIGAGSCADQVNNPCHAYDNLTLRENNLSAFFANLVNTSPICDTALVLTHTDISQHPFLIYPNPATQVLHIKSFSSASLRKVSIMNSIGEVLHQNDSNDQKEYQLHIANIPPGIYVLKIVTTSDITYTERILKE